MEFGRAIIGRQRAFGWGRLFRGISVGAGRLMILHERAYSSSSSSRASSRIGQTDHTNLEVSARLHCTPLSSHASLVACRPLPVLSEPFSTGASAKPCSSPLRTLLGRVQPSGLARTISSSSPCRQVLFRRVAVRASLHTMYRLPRRITSSMIDLSAISLTSTLSPTSPSLLLVPSAVWSGRRDVLRRR